MARHKRLYWFVCEGGGLALGVSDHPGGETDLYLAGPLRDLIRVYRGDITLESLSRRSAPAPDIVQRPA